MNSSSLQGSTLGKYAILQPLGRGGMAQVYKGYHQQLDRFVAIKVLRSDLIEEPDFLTRFQREARSVAALHHPHIVQVFDFDVQKGIYFMVMELLEGDSLKAFQYAYRKNSLCMPISFSIKILLDVLSGLAYAHSAGIIHRDLKPANILLNNRGQAILTDFGIAHMAGGTQHTASGAMMGTFSYMAPEQGLKNQYDFRSDIYSIGVIAYELLTGQVPFEADTPVAVLLKHINDNLIPPRELNLQIPREFELIVTKSLAKKPEERFQNTAELIDALMIAAKISKIDIPDYIYFPASLIEKNWGESQTAVYSGSARQDIPDISFSTGDTDSSISSQKIQPFSEKEGNDLLNQIFNIPKDLKVDDLRKYSTKQTILLAIFIFILANIIMLWIGGIYGWKIIQYSWPMELTAISLLLSFLMASKATPWLLIPIGLLLGNSVLLASSTIMGRWDLWTYTWPAEAFLIAGSIILPIYLARKRLNGRWVSQKLAIILSTISGLSLAVILITSLLKVIFH